MIQNQFLDQIELTEDYFKNALNIEIIGQNAIAIYGHLYIEQFCSSAMIVCGKKEKLVIEGKDIRILCYSKYELQLRGIFATIKWIK